MRQDIDKIIEKYFSGEISHDDEQKLISWLNANQKNSDHFDDLKKFWNTSVEYPRLVDMHDQKENLWEKLHGEKYRLYEKPNKKYTIYNQISKIAATVIILISIGYLINRALDQDVLGKNYIELVECVNPLGQKSRIQLPDGSTVWLNAASKLSYSSDFGNQSRNLLLEGEAYFEVVKNPNLPFKVSTKGMIVTVLGTSFNVCSYAGEKSERVALNTGKVMVELKDSIQNSPGITYLEPGELVTYRYQSKEIEHAKIGDLDPFGWKEGRIVFKKASFTEVMEVLARWYNVEFVVEGKLNRAWNFESTFDNETLENVLEGLKYTQNIEYKINGSIIKIKL